MVQDELVYLNAFNLIPYVGPVRIKALGSYCADYKEAWRVSADKLKQVDGWHGIADRFVADRQKIDVENEWGKLEKEGVLVLAEDDPRYPANLSGIHNPPPLLYVKGQPVFSPNAVAIVGSRKGTVYGQEVAFKLAKELAMLDIAVISGMALGIDTRAHKGALQGSGFTVAVLGCGLDKCYPPDNRSLMQRIAAEGAVVTEFPLRTSPMPSYFPRRNRIISGMSLGTVVVEAMEKSGALITADFALEQGREVFAVPGNINSPYSRGCNRLIKQGAALVESVDDILAELGILISVNADNADNNESGGAGVKRGELSAEESELLEIIPYQPIHADELIQLSGRSPAQISSILLSIELKGLIRQIPGKYFTRV